MIRHPRWICEGCGRYVSTRYNSPDEKVCTKCKNRKEPNLYSLKSVPDMYFKIEKIKYNQGGETMNPSEMICLQCLPHHKMTEHDEKGCTKKGCTCKLPYKEGDAWNIGEVSILTSS